jgi:hypothetical protein
MWNLRQLAIALVVAAGSGAPALDQSSPPPAVDLIHEMTANELADRVAQHRWMYLIDKRDGKRTITEEQVETKDGPLYRVVAIDRTPLNPDQRQQEDVRMDSMLQDPSQQLKSKQRHEEDEQKLEKLIGLLPEAFLFDYDGMEGNSVRIKFRPNPDYTPKTYEARVAHCLAGIIMVDAQQKRLAKLSGQLVNGVEFGYGLLGHIDNGGTIEIGRVQVAPSQWKTALVNIQLSGRLMFFKTINKQQYEIRSEFRAVSGDLSLLEARSLLAH